MVSKGKKKKKGFPDSSVSKESACNAGDSDRFLGWEDPLRRERLPTPVFWLEELNGLYSPWGCKESDTTERLPLSLSDENGLLRWHSGKGPIFQCRRCKRHGFDPWVGKIPWRRA